MNFMNVKTYDTVGYMMDGYVLCLECGNDHEEEPIFAGDEFEYAPTCDNCNRALEVNNLFEN